MDPDVYGWDVTPDGQKFLLVSPIPQTNAPRLPITVVMNWPQLLKGMEKR